MANNDKGLYKISRRYCLGEVHTTRCTRCAICSVGIALGGIQIHMISMFAFGVEMAMHPWNRDTQVTHASCLEYLNKVNIYFACVLTILNFHYEWHYLIYAWCNFLLNCISDKSEVLSYNKKRFVDFNLRICIYSMNHTVKYLLN